MMNSDFLNGPVRCLPGPAEPGTAAGGYRPVTCGVTAPGSRGLARLSSVRRAAVTGR